MRGRVGEGYKLILQQKSEERELKTENWTKVNSESGKWMGNLQFWI
jgi:hypothetical protein